MRAALTEALREMLQYSPTPTGTDAIAVYDYADLLLDSAEGTSTQELLESLQDVIDYALEPVSHHQHMVREQAQRILKEARAAV